MTYAMGQFGGLGGGLPERQSDPDAETTIDGTETMEHRWRRTQAIVVETNKRLDALAAERDARLMAVAEQRDRLKAALSEIAAGGCEMPCTAGRNCGACIAAKALEGK